MFAPRRFATMATDQYRIIFQGDFGVAFIKPDFVLQVACVDRMGIVAAVANAPFVGAAG